MQDYQILLYEDKIIEEGSNTYSTKEIPICELGSSLSSFEGKAKDPVFTTKIDGTHELKFSIPSIYYDEGTGEYVDNEIVQHIVNKSKIRLKKTNRKTGKSEFFSLVVNTKVDKDDNDILSYEYTCTDAFIEELSKTGYQLIFHDDPETGTGLGTIHELAERILEGTEWEYLPEKTGHLQEYTTDLSYNIGQGRYDTVYKPVPVFPVEYIKPLKRYCTKLSPEEVKDGKQYYCYESTYQITSNTVKNLLYNAKEPTDFAGWKTYNRDNQGKVIDGWLPSLYAYTWATDKKKHYGIKFTKGKNGSKTTYLLNDSCASTNEVIKANQPYIFRFTTPETKYYSSYIKGLYIYDKNPAVYKDAIPSYEWRGSGHFEPGKHYYVIKTTVNISRPYFVFEIQYNKDGEQQAAGQDFAFYTMNFYEAKGRATTSGGVSTSAEDNNIYLLSTLTDKKIFFNGTTNIPEYAEPWSDISSKICPLELDIKNEAAISAYTEKNMLYFYLDEAKNNSDEQEAYYVNFKDDICPSGKIAAETKESFLKDGTPDPTKVYKSEENGGYYQYYQVSRGDITNCAWGPALIAPSDLNEKTRTLIAEKSNRFNLLQELAELFKAWCVFEVKEEDGILKKYVWFKENAINQNFAGFHKGVNLKSLERKSDSSNIVTKLFVEQQENNYTDYGVVTIQNASLNPWGEGYFYNFKYYVDSQLLNQTIFANGAEQLKVDYDLNNLYSAVKGINTDLKTISNKRNQLDSDLTSLNSQKTALVSYIATKTDSITSKEAEINNSKISDEDRSKAKADLSRYESERDTYEAQLDQVNYKIAQVEKDLEDIKREFNSSTTEKQTLIRNFENEYAPYIKEGVWSDSTYVDDDSYYYDAQKVSNTSAIPQTSWTISVLDGNAIEDLEDYVFSVGDQTFLVDDHFFKTNILKNEEYKFEVLISSIVEYLDTPLKNQIEVRNYLTSFEDLFQRISAATQTLDLKEHIYDKAAYFTSDHQIDKSILQNTLRSNELILANAMDNSYVLDSAGLYLQSVISPGKKMRLIADGLFFSNSMDLQTGQPKWTTGITADGINASILTAGEINTSLIKIYSDAQPSFTWGELGITAYEVSDGKIEDNNFIRLDQFGLYQINDNNNFQYDQVNEGDAGAIPWFSGLSREQALDQIVDSSKFCVTSRGFQVNISNTVNVKVNDWTLRVETEKISLGKIPCAEEIEDGLNIPNAYDAYGLYIKGDVTTNNTVIQELVPEETVVRLSSDGFNVISGWNFSFNTLRLERSNGDKISLSPFEMECSRLSNGIIEQGSYGSGSFSISRKNQKEGYSIQGRTDSGFSIDLYEEGAMTKLLWVTSDGVHFSKLPEFTTEQITADKMYANYFRWNYTQDGKAYTMIDVYTKGNIPAVKINRLRVEDIGYFVGDLYTEGQLSVTGSATMKNNLTVSNNLTVENNLTVSNSLSVGDGFSVWKTKDGTWITDSHVSQFASVFIKDIATGFATGEYLTNYNGTLFWGDQKVMLSS